MFLVAWVQREHDCEERIISNTESTFAVLTQTPESVLQNAVSRTSANVTNLMKIISSENFKENKTAAQVLLK